MDTIRQVREMLEGRLGELDAEAKQLRQALTSLDGRKPSRSGAGRTRTKRRASGAKH